VISQKQALQTGLLEREAMRKLHLKTVNELTKMELTLELVRDSVKHNGQIITIHDTLFKEKNAILLPFDFYEKNKFLDFSGRFDNNGKMSFNLKAPINLDVYTGIEKRTRKAITTITIDNPYVVINEIKSVKLDLPRPKKYGIGIVVGYGVTSKRPMEPSVLIGVGLSYNLLSF
jgi:hypothetical protein